MFTSLEFFLEVAEVSRLSLSMEQNEEHESLYQEAQSLIEAGLKAEADRNIEKAFAMHKQAVECLILYLKSINSI